MFEFSKEIGRQCSQDGEQIDKGVLVWQTVKWRRGCAERPGRGASGMHNVRAWSVCVLELRDSGVWTVKTGEGCRAKNESDAVSVGE
mmetsp:Transcript_9819/g.25106  ORF Transcript_9819/g.25106 Transcript_9819/m.25106 type:complete len:87 (-) Transcript_9819:48-308(-)